MAGNTSDLRVYVDGSGTPRILTDDGTDLATKATSLEITLGVDERPTMKLILAPASIIVETKDDGTSGNPWQVYIETQILCDNCNQTIVHQCNK